MQDDFVCGGCNVVLNWTRFLLHYFESIYKSVIRARQIVCGLIEALTL